MDKEQSPNAEWQFGLIAESAKNLRQIYFVYLGFISYGALTVLSSSDRELVLNDSVHLPVVNVQVPLTAFYFAGPLLAVVIFLHLQIGLVELKRLMLRVSIEPSAPRIYPWIVPRSILLLNRKLSWQFTDQLQVALTLLSVYASLPLVLFVFATAYTRAHAPTLSYVVATLPVLGSVLAIVFYFNMVEGGLRSIREVIRSEWGLLLAALVIGTIPYDIIVVIDAILLYLAVLPLVIVAAIVAVGFIGIVAISRSAPLQARLRKAWQKVGIWLLLIVMVVATTMVFAVFEHSLSIVAFSSLAIAPLALTIAYVMGGIKGRPPTVLVSFLFVLIALHIGLFRLVWLSNRGEGKNVDLSYQVLVGQAKVGETADIASLDLTNAHLEGANLKHAILPHALLRNAHLSNADLSGAIFDGVDLSGADLFGADLSGASLKNAILDNSKLVQARFERADMRGCSMRGISLQSTYFTDAKLGDADLTSADANGGFGFGLTTEQLLSVKSLRYAQLPETQGRLVVERAPQLIFGTGEKDSSNGLAHLTEILLYAHPNGSQFTRTQLHELLVDVPWGYGPRWKKEAFVSYFGERAIQMLLKADLLKQTDDAFTIPETPAVAAARARFPQKPG